MPVRINLKEVFISDPEEITLEKINFNFNELIRLGLGKKGDIGITGPEGAIGPYGLQGIPGERGNKWFTGVGNPNGQSFVDLKDGDFFLDADASSIWEYDSDSGTWSKVTDLSEVVNNFLAEAGQTFKRGFGEGSPQDQRFITFLNRDDSINDSSLGNASDNDIFFLHNFEELDTDIINFAASTNDYFNSLQSIYVQQTISPVGRYHLELGALYDDVSISPAAPALTDVNENLKVRFLKQNISSPLFATSNPYVSISRFSMSIPETGGSYKGNGIFEFITPKYNTDTDPFQGDLTVRIGSREGVSEFSSGSIDTDGIEMAIAGSLSVNLGFALDYEGSGNDYFLIDTNGLEAVFVNNEVIQDNGNIKQRATGEFPLETKRTAPSNLDRFPESHWQNQGFAMAGTRMVAVSGNSSPGSATDLGYIHTLELTDPSNPTIETDERRAAIATLSGMGPTTPTTYVMGSGISDVQLAGEYAYFVNNVDTDTSLPFDPFIFYDRPHFQIARFQGDGFNLVRQSYLKDDTLLDGAYRLEVRGQYAYVVTSDNHSTSIGFGAAVGRLTSIDISDPLNPVVADSFNYATGGGDKFVDLDVQDKRAAVIRISSGFIPIPTGFFNVDLVVYDISDPTSITEAMNSVYGTTIFSGPAAAATTNPQYGGVKLKGNYAYVAWKDQLFIYDINRPFQAGVQSPTQLSTLSLGLPTGEWAIDIEVVGTDAYVLADDRTTDPDSPAVVIKIDVSDPSNPEVISYSRISEMAKASRIKYSGKYLYAITAADSTTSPNQEGGIVVIDTDGFDSPGAQIDNLRASTLDVSMEAHIQRLNITDSLNVGPGGIYVDEGRGVVADGKIVGNVMYTKGIGETFQALIQTYDNFDGGYYLRGQGANLASYDSAIDLDTLGQWGIQYIATTANQNENGINFWKPFPSVNSGNYKLFLADNGNIGIGTGNPSGKLHVAGGDLYLDGGNNIRIPGIPHTAGTANYVAVFTPSTGILASSATTLSAAIASDENLKKNINKVTDSDAILEIDTVSFEWKDPTGHYSDGTNIGVIAQQVKEHIPEAVFADKQDDFLCINWPAMTSMLIHQVKKQNEKIKSLEERLSKIEEKMGLK